MVYSAASCAESIESCALSGLWFAQHTRSPKQLNKRFCSAVIAACRAVQDRTYLGILEAAGPQLAAWVRTDSFSAQMASLFPFSAAEQPSCEQATQQQCSEAFSAVQMWESSHNLVLQNMPLQYLQQRTTLVSSLLEKGTTLGLKDEVVHDGVLLLDRTASTGTQVIRKERQSQHGHTLLQQGVLP